MLYVPLNLEIGLTMDALVDSRAYLIAGAKIELDRIRKRAPTNVFKVNDSPNFQVQVANDQL